MIVGRVGEGFLRDLRIRVFNHLQRLSMPFYDRERAGVVVSRMTSDVDSLAELVQTGLLMFLMNALLLVFSLIVLAIVSWQLLLVCLIAVPFVVLASVCKKVSPAFV
jgi:ATP-binding cassette, subfamily B, bacterial